jgi:hypothetical protein
MDYLLFPIFFGATLKYEYEYNLRETLSIYDFVAIKYIFLQT